mmetsp:Transcript_32252/g.55919  ORF Transcript_32252/g.55919 Transcript_32252/m.55919 type:complete len:444 (-) Transcript_32252:185-1516(-)
MGCSSSSAVARQTGTYAGFECREKIGEGTFGQVYAFDSTSGTKCCAVKLIEKEKVAKHEAQMWRYVSGHENVVGLFHAFLRHGIYHLVMEKCLDSLHHRLAGKLSSGEAELQMGRIFREMLTGVEFVHSRGVVHRDLKPDNFLLGGEDGWTVKICDFGTAVLMPPGAGKLHSCCGTPLFMSPEMLSGKGYGCATDMWSLGATVYWTLYGDFPYMVHGVPPDDDKICEAILEGEPEPSFLAACDTEKEFSREPSQGYRDDQQVPVQSQVETKPFFVDWKVDRIGLTFVGLPPGKVMVKQVLPYTSADAQDIAPQDMLDAVNGLDVRRLTSNQFKNLMQKRPLAMLFSTGASNNNGGGYGRLLPTKAVEKFARALLDRSPCKRCTATEALQSPCLHSSEVIPCAPVFHEALQSSSQFPSEGSPCTPLFHQEVKFGIQLSDNFSTI